MLFSPWRNEPSDLLGEFDSYSESYKQKKDQIDKKRKEFEPNFDLVRIIDAGIAEQVVDNYDDIAQSTQNTEAIDSEQHDNPAENYVFFTLIMQTISIMI